MAQALSVWWQPVPNGNGARVLRLCGDSPCPALPAALDGVPVTELGPYCLAAKELPLPAGARLWGAGHPHRIGGQFLEELTLPPALHTLHSAALYDCRRLRRLTLGPDIAALGSDLFTNCRALETVRITAEAGAHTGLKRLLVALAGDITVEFWPPEQNTCAARLYYPDYNEFLDENTPAHLFNRQIEGEGYRYRQCFAGTAVDYAAYDAVFAQAAVGEPPAKLCRLALGRLLYPFALSAAARAAYETYLQRNSAAALALAVAGRDTAALRLLGTLGQEPAQAAAACAAAGWSEGAAAVFGGGDGHKKRYDFDDL